MFFTSWVANAYLCLLSVFPEEVVRGMIKNVKEVHEIYENLKNIVDNSSDFSEYEISQYLAEAEDNYPYRHGRYSGNYNADLAEKDSLVYKFYTNYKRKQTLYTKTRKNRPNDLGKEIYDLISKVTEIDNES